MERDENGVADADIPRRRVLVLMSTYNGERYLKPQLRSILRQRTRHQVDIRIRDDGSTDGTPDIIEGMRQRHPDRITYSREGNVGINASFFSLIAGSGGYDYYAISDQDDVWLPGKVERAVESLESEGGGGGPLLYASPSLLAGDDLKPYGMTRTKKREFTLRNTIIQTICPGHSQVFNNALLERLKKPLDVERVYMYDSWITNMAALYGRIVYDGRPGALYRQHGGNQMGSGGSGIGKLATSATRALRGDGRRYREQAAYFIEQNGPELRRQGLYEELHDFATAGPFPERLRACLRGGICRQSRVETAAYYAAYLAGLF